MAREAETYVHGVGPTGKAAPVVIVSARAAAFLNRHARLDDFRRSSRGTDKEIDDILVALSYAGSWWRNSVTGTKPTAPEERTSKSEWLTTRQAATQAQVSQRAIRKAIEENRIAATRVGKAWHIAQIDFQHYLSRRTRNRIGKQPNEH